jgi:hypothetical protein
MTGAPDLIPPRTWVFIVQLAARRGMTEWSTPPDTLMAVGDGETFYELVRDGDRIAFVEVQRGHRVVQIRFAGTADAVRYLMFALSDQYSAQPRRFAPGTMYAPDGEDWILRWPGGQATSPGGRLSVVRARAFSWIVTDMTER